MGMGTAMCHHLEFCVDTGRKLEKCHSALCYATLRWAPFLCIHITIVFARFVSPQSIFQSLHLTRSNRTHSLKVWQKSILSWIWIYFGRGVSNYFPNINWRGSDKMCLRADRCREWDFQWGTFPGTKACSCPFVVEMKLAPALWGCKAA